LFANRQYRQLSLGASRWLAQPEGPQSGSDP
jgi:hypothetical protein